MLYRSIASALALTLGMSTAHAMDYTPYKSLVRQTIQELIANNLADPKATLARQEQEMELAIAGCKEFAIAQPKFAALMRLVIASASAMKKMKPEELEDAWGDEGSAGDRVGFPLKGLDQFAIARNYLDSVVHPARAYAFINAYVATKDKQNLEDAKGELVEVLEHVSKIEASKMAAD